MQGWVKKRLLPLSLVFGLLGCHEKTSYEYLMQHPGALQRVLLRCQAAALAKECEDAARALADFNVILREQQSDPEAFGKRVLKAQYELVQLRGKWKEAKKTGTELQIMSARKAYQAKKSEVKTLLAVIGTQSPE